MALLPTHPPLLQRLAGLAAAVLALALTAQVLPARGMTFQAVSGPQDCAAQACILATGEIDADSATAFKSFLRTHNVRPGALVVLNSQGGGVLQSLVLGGQVRKAGLATTVQNYDPASGAFVSGGVCASACTYMFLGGVQRSVGSGARLGVHQMSQDMDARDPQSVSDAQWLTSLIALHIERMGGGVGLLCLALRTAPQDVRWLSPGELARLGVTTAMPHPLMLASN